MILKTLIGRGGLVTRKLRSLSVCRTSFADEIKVDAPDAPKEASIIAVSPWGMMRGIESFSHLLYTSAGAGESKVRKYT